MNSLYFIMTAHLLKRKQDREYDKAKSHYKNLRIQQDKKNTVDIPITWRACKIVFMIGIFGGFMIGFVGVGMSLLMLLILKKYNVNS